MSTYAKYTRRLILFSASIGVLAGPLSGCTVSITEREVFQPNEEQRREGGTDLALDNEQELPAEVSLTHFRQPVRGGQMAITIAKTSARRLIVHCGGNASERKSDGVGQLQKLIPFGNALLFDYPGYGDSEGGDGRRLADREARVAGRSLDGWAQDAAVARGAVRRRPVLLPPPQTAAQLSMRRRLRQCLRALPTRPLGEPQCHVFLIYTI